MLDQYFKDIFNTTKTGDAREESYYSDLKRLIENWAKSKNKNLYITTLPKKTEAGNPDFRIWDGKQKIIGYIEAKTPTTENLKDIESSEQLKRYRQTFPNLILTNFFEFRLYRNGELIKKIAVGRPFIIHELKLIPPVENQKEFLDLLEQFFSFSIPKTTTAKTLALELAKRTRFLRNNVISEELKEENSSNAQTLSGFYKAFKDHLIFSLTHDDFANLFSQTITYGLFAARSRAEDGFNRELAYKYIPHTIGILRDVFRFISSTELPQSMEWIIDDIAEVLSASDVKKIISDFYKEGKGRDPIIHFYETFLAEYDPREREKRGVYYTPEPVVSYIVRSIHQLLKEKFGKEDGFATESVTVLDPAAGTLTFPVEAIHQAIEEYKKKYGNGGISSLIHDQILKNFFAFELMMAPYAMGHLKIGFVLNELNYKLSEDERFNLYLTNTLDFTKEDPNQFPGIFEKTIAKESEKALKVKEDIPIMVIMGNPPYSGQSENKSHWILEQMKEYKQIEGKPLGERNPKWLQDDYVKFFRFAQWKIEQTGRGIIGYITNHAWLDNPTFRGMRASLLKTFDEVYILNLHGSMIKKEKTPSGGRDENVFDIRPGVAITIGIKSKKPENKKIFYADLWGLREEKYSWLDKNNAESTKWKKIDPKSPDYFLVPKEEKNLAHYQKFLKINEIFPINSVGIVTARDELTIQKSTHDVWNTVLNFSSMELEMARAGYNLGKDAQDWRIEFAQKDLKESGPDRKFIVPVLYRPFDVRYTYYTGKSRGFICRPRYEVMKNMLRPNLALFTSRIVRGDQYQHCLVSESISDAALLASNTASSSYIFPLYLYGDKEKSRQASLLAQEEAFDKKPNINQKVFDLLEQTFGKKVGSEEIFYYIYSILFANIYRQKYNEFLKSDFPRIPFTKNYKLFQKLAELGTQLTDLHLLKSIKLNNPSVKFLGKNNDRVSKMEYQEKEKRIYINADQYFENVKPEVWNYYVGGHQVLNKWLKDRKNQALSSEDIKHYCKIITALEKTIEVQKEIDKLYTEIEKSLVK